MSFFGTTILINVRHLCDKSHKSGASRGHVKDMSCMMKTHERAEKNQRVVQVNKNRS